jgi:hypothetical protein
LNDNDNDTRGIVDESHHGWAPDAPGTGEAKERAVEANRKAFEARDTQAASRGDGTDNPDFPPEGVGESVTRRGEQVVQQEGPDEGRVDLGTQGRSERPVGTSTARAATGVDPQESADPDMPNAQPGDQGG